MRAFILATSFSAFAATASGAELQQSCVKPPATVVEITGVNTTHARARAKFTEPDIVKACHEGYVHQGGFFVARGMHSPNGRGTPRRGD